MTLHSSFHFTFGNKYRAVNPQIIDSLEDLKLIIIGKYFVINISHFGCL